MPRFYIEAFDTDGDQILGNLDGQAACEGKGASPRRLSRVKHLYLPAPARPQYPRVKFWRVVSEHGTIYLTINNHHHQQEPR